MVVNYQNMLARKKKEEFDNLLQEKDEWLNSEGYESTLEKYEQNLNDLKNLGNPIQKREEEARKKTWFD